MKCLRRICWLIITYYWKTTPITYHTFVIHAKNHTHYLSYMRHTCIRGTLRQYRVHGWRLCYIWERASQCKLIVAFCSVVFKHRQVYYWWWFRFRRSRYWLSVWITWLFVVRLCMLEEHSSLNCNSVEGTVGSYWREDLCFLWKGSAGWLPGAFWLLWWIHPPVLWLQ